MDQKFDILITHSYKEGQNTTMLCASMETKNCAITICHFFVTSPPLLSSGKEL